MSIRGKIGGQIAFDVTSVEAQCIQPSPLQLWAEKGTFADQEKGPGPRQTSESHFETACPIHANGISIVFMPRGPFRKDLVYESFLSRDAVSLRERHEVLMAVQLPNDFGISDFLEIEIPNLEPGLQWRTTAVHGIEMPIDLRSVVQIFVPKQIEAVAANLLRSQNDLIRLRRTDPLQLCNQCRDIRAVEEELPKSFCFRLSGPGKIVAGSMPKQVAAGGHILP
jgi:hypothetical protein